MIYNIFHSYDHGIINYVCIFLKKYLIIFRFQKHNLQVSKCHKMGVFQSIFTHQKKKGKLTTYLNTQPDPTRKCWGWVSSGWGVKKPKIDLTQPEPD